MFLSTLTMVSSAWYIGKKFKSDDKIEYGTLSLYIFGVTLGQGKRKLEIDVKFRDWLSDF